MWLRRQARELVGYWRGWLKIKLAAIRRAKAGSWHVRRAPQRCARGLILEYALRRSDCRRGLTSLRREMLLRCEARLNVELGARHAESMRQKVVRGQVCAWSKLSGNTKLNNKAMEAGRRHCLLIAHSKLAGNYAETADCALVLLRLVRARTQADARRRAYSSRPRGGRRRPRAPRVRTAGPCR